MQTPTWHEQAITFDCEGCRLIGIVTQPETQSEHGVVIVVGGPQYRAGSHRQFTLLARDLAENGITSIRFDYRGMGDSEGEIRNFEHIEADIRAAIDALSNRVPGLCHIALWGLCDAASAALYYGHTDSRVRDLILLNPWVHSAAGAARAQFKYYYLARLTQKSFWAKLLSGKFDVSSSASDMVQSARLASAGTESNSAAPQDPRHGSPGYIARMLEGLKEFNGNVRCVLSGRDLTAQEFRTLLKQDKGWQRACRPPKTTMVTLAEANHTFSNTRWRKQVSDWTSQWIKENRRAGTQK